MMRKEIIFILPVLAAMISLVAAVGITSVNAQNMTGNETGTDVTVGANMTNATVGGNMTDIDNMSTTSPVPIQ